MTTRRVRESGVGVARELCLPRLLFGTIRPVLTPVVSLSFIIVYTRVGTPPPPPRHAGLGKCALNLTPPPTEKLFLPPPRSRPSYPVTGYRAAVSPSRPRPSDRPSARNNITKADCKPRYSYIYIRHL